MPGYNPNLTVNIKKISGLHTTRDMSKLAMAGLPATRGKGEHFCSWKNEVQGVKLMHILGENTVSAAQYFVLCPVNWGGGNLATFGVN